MQQMLESTPGVPAAAVQHAAAANRLADALAANPGNDSAALTTAIQTTANAAAATVQDLLQSTNSDSGPIDISTAPEVRDELTPDPELGLAPRCSVIPFGCVEHAHGDGPNGPVTNEERRDLRVSPATGPVGSRGVAAGRGGGWDRRSRSERRRHGRSPLQEA